MDDRHISISSDLGAGVMSTGIDNDPQEVYIQRDEPYGTTQIRLSLAEARKLCDALAQLTTRRNIEDLLAYIAELEPIVRAVAERDGEVHGSVIVCHYGCGANTTALKDIPLDHTPDCPVIRARALNIPPTKEISE